MELRRVGATTSRGRPASVVALTVLGAAWLAACGGPAEDDARAALRREVAVLRHRVELAREGRLHLVLSAADSTLTLVHGGATLRVWPVREVELGSRRLPFGRGRALDDWREHVWEQPRLDPPVRVERRVIVSDSVTQPDLSGAVDWIPPTPEEAVPTPPRFVARFGEGLGLEVVAHGPDSLITGPGIGGRLAGALRRLHPLSWDRYRIRVHMDAAEAGSLYRSFPRDAAFVALIPNR